jgi:hypothetical protein
MSVDVDWKELVEGMELERELSPDEQAIVLELYRRKDAWDLPTHAYVTTVNPIAFTSGDPKKIPPGTTLKIVMVSRFGDCGLTDDLKANHGYQTRIAWHDSSIKNIRWQP